MQRLKKLLTFFLTLSVLSALGFSNCGQTIDYTVVIEYEEAATCGLFQQESGTLPQQTTAAGGGLFVIYKIVSIRNNASGAKDFAFTPDKVFVNAGSKGTAAGGILSAHQTASPRVIPKGTTASNVGRIIINVPGDPKDIQNSDNNLLYESATGESVIFTRRPSNKQVLGTCTPSNLPRVP